MTNSVRLGKVAEHEKILAETEKSTVCQRTYQAYYSVTANVLGYREHR